jgi:predicted metal-dependent hydrolase
MKQSDKPQPELLYGIEEFNRHEFFECHETLEELWQTQTEPDRQFTQGIIQIAVGYYHQWRNNRVGACKLFKRGLERIKNFQPHYHGIKVTEFIGAVERDLLTLEKIEDGETLERFAPKIEFIATP